MSVLNSVYVSDDVVEACLWWLDDLRLPGEK